MIVFQRRSSVTNILTVIYVGHVKLNYYHSRPQFGIYNTKNRHNFNVVRGKFRRFDELSNVDDTNLIATKNFGYPSIVLNRKKWAQRD